MRDEELQEKGNHCANGGFCFGVLVNPQDIICVKHARTIYILYLKRCIVFSNIFNHTDIQRLDITGMSFRYPFPL